MPGCSRGWVVPPLGDDRIRRRATTPRWCIPTRSMVKLWLIALVAANALRTRQQLRFFLVFWLACFAFYPVRGALFNYYLYGENARRARDLELHLQQSERPRGVLHPAALDGARAATRSRRRDRCDSARGSASAVLPLLILLTKSRGAFLGFAVFLLFALWGQRRRGQRDRHHASSWRPRSIFVAPENVLDRVFALKKIEETGNVDAADEEGSAEQRYEIWKVARTDHSRASGRIGVGLGAYPAEHRSMARQPQFDPDGTWAARHAQHLPERDRRDGLHRILSSGRRTYLAVFVAIDSARRKLKKTRPRDGAGGVRDGGRAARILHRRDLRLDGPRVVPRAARHRRCGASWR